MASSTPRSEALAAWLADRRWFAGRTRRIAGVEIDDRIGVGRATLTVVRARFEDGTEDRYAVPLAGGAGQEESG